MAGSGPAAKPDAQRRRRNTPTHGAERVIVDDGRLRGPALADIAHALPTDADLLRSLEQWWETWRRSPMAKTFLSTDWQRLAFLAPLVTSYWLEPKAGTLAEIRLNEERLGATVTDRLKARIRVEPKDAEVRVEGNVISAQDRFRDRLDGE